jgi:hypothetical protein
MATFTTKFNLKDKTYIDNDKTSPVIIIGVILREDAPATYEVAWFSNGDHKTAWIEEWRIGDKS